MRPLRVLFSAPTERWAEWETPLREAFQAQGLQVELATAFDDPASVDYIVAAPNGPVRDFSPYSRARAVLSTWAGVESFLANPTLTQPLTRMVDPGLVEGMVEYVVGHVLRHHLGMDAHIVNPEHRWEPTPPPLARDRRVAVLGLGALGGAAAEALARLNFAVSGWSRSPRDMPGVICHHGEAGLRAVLAQAEIVVLLLPLTPHTDGLMNAERLGWLPRGAVLINPGRGALIDDEALLAALDSGHLAHATLDVFRTEPLPAGHPFWTHPRVTVTPHIASETRPSSAARMIAENIARAEKGEPLLHLVDRERGY
ncbi:glyoxylate/hydroxypyruvate reductase A [Meinhardsimonia xiamenensis]|jgi:glyoxylate/hydroxypyruvate reductase A|uniref:Glyoxylate/hydroxypyruvate reductase A n=1 Tax=Meinhardsimonia xiamenensis TaxID=990712 RepID=A0A1G9ED32_9RHOB|nr:glyoxylate/hydroxypyruvate reductase A [Meinhardsimonia xiamenensis]PRX33821.1 glyoxylate/hydroxypyruvate reductase A [Meinhardsimonia xiamenensis]SDK74080.1 glyoxylate/hydroxypyruvate reductase A [Meinhardsimonia xiamenensis]